MIVEHGIGFLLCVPALFNLIEDRKLALGLFSLGAVLE